METKPMLCQVVTEFVILHKQVELSEGILGNVNHQISLGHDGSVYTKEVLVTVARDIKLNESTSHTFEEFAGKFPDDAEIIRKFANKNNVIVPGMDKRCYV